jgi:hypothetical protein
LSAQEVLVVHVSNFFGTSKQVTLSKLETSNQTLHESTHSQKWPELY